MKVRNKLILTSIIPILVIGILSIFIQVWNRALFVESFEVSVKKLDHVQEMEYLESETFKNLLIYILLQGEDERKAFEANTINLHLHINEYKKFPQTEEEKQAIAGLEKGTEQMLSVQKSLFALADRRVVNIKVGRELLYNKIDPLLITEWEKKLTTTSNEFHEKTLLMNKIQINLYKAMAASRGYMLYPAPELKKIVIDNMNQVMGEMKNLGSLNLDKQELLWHNQLNDYVEQLEALVTTNLELEDTRLQLMKEVEAIVLDMKYLIHNKLEVFANTNLKQNAATINQLNSTFISILLAIIFISIATTLLFAKYLMRPIETLKYAIEQLRKGEDVDLKRSSNDEIGDVTEAFGEMIQENKKHATEMSEQNWLKEHLNEILKTAQVESELDKMCNLVITKIATILDAGCAAFYITKQDKDSKHLELRGSYAYKKRKNVSNQFKFGEGLVGQSALEGQPILLSDVPDDYINITSGLGNKKPTYISVHPIMLEQKALGVIEIALFHELKSIQLQFLEQLTLNLAAIIEAIQSREATETALTQVQKQSEELQAQQEELRASNEELEEKTHSLQQSEEELKTQSEELLSTNAELEEQMHAIELQKQEIQRKNNELKKIQLDLEEKAKSLSLSGQYKTEFLSNMSHELRTPLNSLLLLSKSFSKNEDGNLTPAQVEEANIIHKGGKDLLELINDILDLSKVEAGKLAIQIEETTFQEIAEDLKRQFDSVVKSKKITFAVKIDINEKTIKTDAHRLKQILRNLISNAVKFTEKGSVSLQITRPDANSVAFKANTNLQNYVVFKVIDTGIGIEKNKHNDIFEAFQQAYGNTDRIYGGTGLGLTISRELAKLLGGEIQLESELGKGSVFSLFLPLEINTEENVDQAVIPEIDSKPAKAPQANTALASLEDDRKITEKSEPSILIIEDDEDFLKVLMEITQKKGYKCITALNGTTGLKLAREFLPQGIILDLGLPDIDGIHVIEILKSDPLTKEIPIHIISGQDETTLPQSFGSIGFLKKPVNAHDLDAVFNTFAQNGSRHKICILLIEDDHVAQKEIQKHVEGKNIHVISASTGKEALEKLKSSTFDGLIMDLNLPDMNGLSFLKKLNRSNIQIPPLIIYSGKDLSEKEYAELNQYTNKIVLKEGDSSLDRLLQECSLFLHAVNNKKVNGKAVSNDENKKMLYEADTVLQGKKILLADDDMRNVYALSRILQRQGMKVTPATNGQEALDKLSEKLNPDLVIMDIMMPIMDGFETMRQIRKQPQFKNLPIIAVTAKAMSEDRKACLDAGANDYITKPIDDDKLLSLIRIWLSK